MGTNGRILVADDDPENPKLADEYGIVMGTSHQEPMLRAQKEWDRRFQKTLGSWNYYKYPEVLQNFWREGIRRNKAYESIVTIGLRGAFTSSLSCLAGPERDLKSAMMRSFPPGSMANSSGDASSTLI